MLLLDKKNCCLQCSLNITFDLNFANLRDFGGGVNTTDVMADLVGMIKQLLYGFSRNSIFIVPLDTNYFPRLRLGKQLVPRGTIKMLFLSNPYNNCILYYIHLGSQWHQVHVTLDRVRIVLTWISNFLMIWDYYGTSK